MPLAAAFYQKFYCFEYLSLFDDFVCNHGILEDNISKAFKDHVDCLDVAGLLIDNFLANNLLNTRQNQALINLNVPL